MDLQDVKVQCDTQINELKKTHLMYVNMQVEMLNAMKQKFGNDVIGVAQSAFCKSSFKPYLPIIEKLEDRSVEKIVEVLWKPLKSSGFDFSMKNVNNGVKVKCTRCPWVMLYEANNAKDWGYNLVCKADSKFVELFNPNIKFERTKTLMQGDKYCNHTYTLE